MVHSPLLAMQNMNSRCKIRLRILACGALNFTSGAGTNLKLGAHVHRKEPKIIFCRAPPLFGSTSTISRFGERFLDGQYSLVSFSFAVLLLAVLPRGQPFVKVGARAPVPYGLGATELYSLTHSPRRNVKSYDRLSTIHTRNCNYQQESRYCSYPQELINFENFPPVGTNPSTDFREYG